MSAACHAHGMHQIRLARPADAAALLALYVCFSRNLARYLARALADVPAVTVQTLHSLMNELVDTAGRRSELPKVDESDLLAVFLPELALEVLLESADAGRFNAVIIDEAQDLLREP